MSEYNRNYYAPGANQSGSGLKHPPQQPFVFANTLPGVTIPEGIRKAIGGFVTLVTIGSLIAFNVVHDSRATKQNSHPIAHSVPGKDCRTAHRLPPVFGEYTVQEGDVVYNIIDKEVTDVAPGTDNPEGIKAEVLAIDAAKNQGIDLNNIERGQQLTLLTEFGLRIILGQQQQTPGSQASLHELEQYDKAAYALQHQDRLTQPGQDPRKDGDVRTVEQVLYETPTYTVTLNSTGAGGGCAK